jgi:hypothetical protein
LALESLLTEGAPADFGISDIAVEYVVGPRASRDAVVLQEIIEGLQIQLAKRAPKTII